MYIGTLGEFTNREDWQFRPMDIVDDDTGDQIDLTTATITVGIYARPTGPTGGAFTDAYYDSWASDCAVLTGSTDDGTITLLDNYTFQILFTRDRILNYFGTFNVGVTVQNAGITKSFVAGSISVVQGYVPV